MQAIEEANVVILVLDGCEGASDQDAHIAGYVLEAGRAAVVAVNKWDAVPSRERPLVKANIERKLKFLDFATFHYISALNLQGLDACLRAVDAAYRSAYAKLPTPKLTRIVREAIEANPPPRKGLTRPKLRFAHQGGSNPPVIVIHGTGIEHLSESYRRFLEHRVRAQFKLNGTPLRIEFRQGRNPYVPESVKRRR
jgi:GTP-binding protein